MQLSFILPVRVLLRCLHRCVKIGVLRNALYIESMPVIKLRVYLSFCEKIFLLTGTGGTLLMCALKKK